MFGKLYKARPNPDCLDDKFSMARIRRINLDAFWSRARLTVASNTAQARKIIEGCKVLRLDGPFYPPGPLPADDHCGYEVAMLMVVASATCNFWSLEPIEGGTRHVRGRSLKKVYLFPEPESYVEDFVPIYVLGPGNQGEQPFRD